MSEQGMAPEEFEQAYQNAMYGPELPEPQKKRSAGGKLWSGISAIAFGLASFGLLVLAETLLRR